MSPLGRSTLMTDAPWSASNAPVSGPETTADKSSTLKPDNGPEGPGMRSTVHHARRGLIGGHVSLLAAIFSPIALTSHGAPSLFAIGVICQDSSETLLPETRN